MRRLVAFLGFMALFSAAYQAGSMYEHAPEEAQLLVDEFMESIRGIDGPGIFVHNTLLALPMFVPGAGAAWGTLTGWSTGFVLAAIITASPEVGEVQPLALLYLSPFGIMELVAYSLAGSRSLLLITRIIKKQSIRQDAKSVAVEVGVVVGLLLAGGLVEYYMIEMALEAGLDIPGF